MLVIGDYKLSERGSSSQVSTERNVGYRVRCVARVVVPRVLLEMVLATSFYSRKGEASVHERAIRRAFKGLFDDVLYSWGSVPSWEFP